MSLITIDAHSHYMPPQVAQNTTFFKQFWSDADNHIRIMDEHYIDKALLLYPTSDAHLNMGGWGNVCAAYNQGIAEIIKKYPGRFIGAGIIPVDAPDQILAELKRIKDLGLTVISLASSYNGVYLDDPLFFPIYEFAQKHKMPIHVHSQIINPIGEERIKDPLLSPVLEYVFDVTMCIGKMMMSGVFLTYPGVNFIFAHYGGVLPVVKERFDSTYAMLRKRNYVKDLGKTPSDYFKNIYFDMSGSRSKGTLIAALEVTDTSHILWGSDYPANQNFKDSLNVINETILIKEERNLLTGANFSRIFA